MAKKSKLAVQDLATLVRECKLVGTITLNALSPLHPPTAPCSTLWMCTFSLPPLPSHEWNITTSLLSFPPSSLELLSVVLLWIRVVTSVLQICLLARVAGKRSYGRTCSVVGVYIYCVWGGRGREMQRAESDAHLHLYSTTLVVYHVHGTLSAASHLISTWI